MTHPPQSCRKLPAVTSPLFTSLHFADLLPSSSSIAWTISITWPQVKSSDATEPLILQIPLPFLTPSTPSPPAASPSLFRLCSSTPSAAAILSSCLALYLLAIPVTSALLSSSLFLISLAELSFLLQLSQSAVGGRTNSFTFGHWTNSESLCQSWDRA